MDGCPLSTVSGSWKVVPSWKGEGLCGVDQKSMSVWEVADPPSGPVVLSERGPVVGGMVRAGATGIDLFEVRLDLVAGLRFARRSGFFPSGFGFPLIGLAGVV